VVKGGRLEARSNRSAEGGAHHDRLRCIAIQVGQLSSWWTVSTTLRSARLDCLVGVAVITPTGISAPSSGPRMFTTGSLIMTLRCPGAYVVDGGLSHDSTYVVGTVGHPF